MSSTTWSGRVMNLYLERLLGWRTVNPSVERKLIRSARSLVRDPSKLNTIPNTGLEVFARRYLDVGYQERLKTLTFLASDLGTSIPEAKQAALQFGVSESPNLNDMRIAVTPAYNRLLQRLINVQSGMRVAVEMRADLLTWTHMQETQAAQSRGGVQPTEPLNELLAELSVLLRDWFSVGMLHLERLTLNSPAVRLIKVLKYSEHVSPKPISSVQDMEKRLGSGRRMYAFFHPVFEDEPLVYVEVALCGNGTVPSHFGELDSAARDLSPPKVAVFNAIASTQDGLRGLTLGEFLIKRVVEELSLDGNLAPLTRFVTLSPIPGFVDFLTSAENRELLESSLPPSLIWDITQMAISPTAPILRVDQLHEHRTNLEELCLHYLFEAKKPGTVRTLDPVANFHLRNGAKMLRLNWMADRDEKRIRESLGMCVNYEYIRQDLEENYKVYTSHGEIVCDRQILKDTSKGLSRGSA